MYFWRILALVLFLSPLVYADDQAVPENDCQIDANQKEKTTGIAQYISNIDTDTYLQVEDSSGYTSTEYIEDLKSKNTSMESPFLHTLSLSLETAKSALGLTDISGESAALVEEAFYKREEQVLLRHVFQTKPLSGNCRVHFVTDDIRRDVKARINEACVQLASFAEDADRILETPKSPEYYAGVRFQTCKNELIVPIISQLKNIIGGGNSSLEQKYAELTDKDSSWQTIQKDLSEKRKEWRTAQEIGDTEDVERIQEEIEALEDELEQITIAVESRLELYKSYVQVLEESATASNVQLSGSQTGTFDVCVLSIGGECTRNVWGDGENSLFTKIIRGAISVVGTLAVVVLIIAGYYLLLSRGDESMQATGKGMILNVVLGLAVVFLSYVLVQAVISFLFSLGG